jgi:acyl transferase domain-containing protein/D-arabinose 1-dehydrogenase-like Zn-dependent alcohol dehydrogenase/acyl carrier protein
MNDFSDRIAGLSPKRLALLAHELHSELESGRQARIEPIAIVGVGCRFPGGASCPDTFWRVLSDGVDAVREVPADRWNIDEYYDPDPDAPGKMSTRFGAFLEHIDTFDAEFFGVAPREARRMEPQQRLLLEVAWEALECAGYAPHALAGSRMGVFVGACAADYGKLQFASLEAVDAYAGSGVAHSMLANRLSYVLDARGPSLAIDTACSSSLVAVHLAVQSLRQRECDTALAGGVNLILTPEASITLSKARMLAPDGRCKTFSADADGYVRGEGCGLVVLKRLADALADRDAIWALIRGSAVNQDGRSNGLTAPNLLAQRDILREALQNGAVAPEHVSLIEAHGTGTLLGDPIEVEALRSVYGAARGPCALGSVKTNVGHLEGAAGIAGLIKCVLALRHGLIPPHLHLRQLNSNVVLEGSPFFIPRSLQEWPTGVERRLAAVSSFGFGGTNAHVVLEEAPTRTPAGTDPDSSCWLLTLSARTETALRSLALRYRDHLDTHRSDDLSDIAFTTHVGRTHFDWRLALHATSLDDAKDQLGEAGMGRDAPGVRIGHVDEGARPAIAFLFTGQGAQYAGMGRSLYERQRVFRDAIERCDVLLRPHLDIPLLDLMYESSDTATRLDRTRYAQPAIFALEWALAELWASWGIEPAAMLGHSVGEVVAACRAGVFSLEDGLRLIAQRGSLMERAGRGGAMAAVFAPRDRVAEAIAPYSPREMSIAACNGPTEVVISGVAAVIQRVQDELAASGITSRRLPGEYAFHSPLLDPILDAFESTASTIRYADQPSPGMVSNLTGRFVSPKEVSSASYWRRHAREPVQFASGLDALAAAGYRLFVEIGPQPTLLGLGARTPWGDRAQWLPSLRKDRDAWSVLLESLGQLHVCGVDVDWSGVHRDDSRRQRVALPTYPFERERHWVGDLASPGVAIPDLLGHASTTTSGEARFESIVAASAPSYFRDHRVDGSVIVPGAHYLAMALAAAERSDGPGRSLLESVVYRRPLTLPEGETRCLQLVLAMADSAGKTMFQVSSRHPASSEWELVATGVLSALSGVGDAFDELAVRSRCNRELAARTFYDRAGERGVTFGPAFTWIDGIWLGEAEALCAVRHGDALTSLPHPGLIDACQQCLAMLLPSDGPAFLPIAVERVEYRRSATDPRWIHGRLHGSVGDVHLYDARGQLVLSMYGVAFAPLPRSKSEVTRWLHIVEWRAVALPPLPDWQLERGHWVLFGDCSGLGERLAAQLRAHGQETVLVPPGHDLEPAVAAMGSEGCRVVDLRSLDAPPLPDPFPQALDCSVRAPLLVAQALIAQKSNASVWWVTQGARAVGAGAPVTAPVQAAVWGLATTLADEAPHIRWRAIDLDPALPASSAATALAATLLAQEDHEPQQALRGGMLYVPRLTRPIDADLSRVPQRLCMARTDGIEQLRFDPIDRLGPRAGEVELRVEATGLNFRDVLASLGLYPGEAPSLGAECAGRIVAVGSGVRDLAVGDRVVALATGSFADYVTVPASMVARLPVELSAVEAATLPIAFLTVRYALDEVAGLRPGERVLVHSAAGGVGLAAVQWAQLRGARVCGTAGSTHKRALLTALGVDIVGDSRALPTVDEMRSACSGVHVVLNALSGDVIPRSLDLLEPGGRFVELGKRAIWSAAQVAQRRPDVSYHVIDLADMVRHGSVPIGDWLRDIVELVRAGRLRPLPAQTMRLRHAEDAFRKMADGGHVGKIVVVGEELPAERALPVRAEGCYVISGGLGAIGLALAEWLVAQGARQLLLASRRPPNPVQQARIAALEAAGATVWTVEIDVADDAAVKQALTGLPVRGVIHAAGVLDDALLGAQDWDRVCRVLSAKVAGAYALDRHTAARELDFFIVCSSAAALLGNAGQAGYAAANAFLDGFVHWRRGRGRPALSLDWGSVDAGMSDRLSTDVRRSWAALGLAPIPLDALGASLEAAVRIGEPQVAVLPVDWGRMPDARPLLKELIASSTPDPRSDERSAELVSPEALDRLVVSSVVRVLGGGAKATIDLDRPLKELGLDSLMAVELRNDLARHLNRQLPATLAFDYPTARALVNYLRQGAGVRPVPRARPAAAEEGIAIVGVSCRLPGGVESPEDFWRLLVNGVDAIGPVPSERWDAVHHVRSDAGTRWGGFLNGVDRFDAAFFGIAPREAVSMDPQQRLLLELSWEALERAGVPAADLSGSPTGVFVGISTNDYGQLQGQIDAYTGTGNSASVAAGRLSYVLGLQGPSMAVDTACSSSLVAVHLACQSLRMGECDLALAGGVNVILNPDGGVYFTQLGVMAADGRCKTFDAAADGYVRSEGCGVVVLKRLSDARRDGDPVVAVIRGSAVNQDGRSNGLTAPNGPAQEAVIRSALVRAGIHPPDVGFVEAHGTGTALGDPIEVQALAAVLGEARGPDPVLVSSVKTNVGHLEAAAGIAGLIKAVLAVQHGQIPPHLHFRTPSPHIDWDRVPVLVPTAVTPWPAGYQKRIAGVSSFGFSGTNAHVVVEEAPRDQIGVEAGEGAREGVEILTISARTPEGVRALAASYRAALAAPGVSLRDVCYTAAVRRSHLEERVAVVGETEEELCAGLEAVERGNRQGLRGRERPKLVFVFPGQGGQHAGMARALLARDAVFRQAVEACDAACRTQGAWRVLEWLEQGEEWATSIERVQPTLFAVQVGLAAVWEAWGIRPDAVIGHSMGEVAAAYVAGILSLSDAARIICRRSALLTEIRGRGGMLSVDLSRAATTQALGGRAGLGVAASNGPRTTVVAGDVKAIDSLAAELEAQGVFCRRVQVDVAAHSEQVAPLEDALEAALAGVAGQAGTRPLYSTVTGDLCAGTACDGGYWVRNLRQPVEFWAALQAMVRDGHRVFVELSPHPVLGSSIGEGLAALQLDGDVRSSLRRGEDDRRVLLETLGALYEQGQPVHWAAFHSSGRLVDLPTYPWQRQRFWTSPGSRDVITRRASAHPLLGERLDVSLDADVAIWQAEIDLSTCALYADHQVMERAVLPASAYLDMALAAAVQSLGVGDVSSACLDHISLEQMLIVPSDGTRRLQLVLTQEAPGLGRFRISSRDAQSPWTLHATGAVSRRPASSQPVVDLADVRARCLDEIEVADFYAAFADRRMVYGPAFRAVSEVWRTDGEALVRLVVPPAVSADRGQYVVHPALLDACLQALAAAVPPGADSQPYVPTAIASVQCFSSPASGVWAHARLEPATTSDGVVHGTVALLDAQGRTVAQVSGFEARRLSHLGDLHEWLYTLRWQPAPPAASGDVPPDSPGTWLIFADRGGVAETLTSFLEARNQVCVLIRPASGYRRTGTASYELDPADASGFRRLLREAVDGNRPCRGAVVLWALDAPEEQGPDAFAVVRDVSCGGVLHLVQALAQTGWRDAPRLCLVTREATAGTPAHAPLWGLARTLAAEHPEFRCTRMDLSAANGPDDLDGLCHACWFDEDEQEMAWRDGVRHVSRFVRARLAPAPPARIRADGVYLLTGAFGGIGLAVARWLVARGARHLMLTGRREPSADARQAIADLQAAGASVVTSCADVAQRGDLERVFERMDGDARALRGVFHCAGVLDDGILLKLSMDRMARVMEPKVAGAWNLHLLTRERMLDYFVLFSSVSALLGSPGQANYTAANAFLDALAHYRRRSGLPASSINWGPWAEVGLAASQVNRGQRLALQGIGSLTPQQGIHALESVLEQPAAQLAILPFDLRHWCEFYPALAGSPLFAELMDAPRAGSLDHRMRDVLRTTEAGERRRVLERHLREQIAEVMRLDASAMAGDASLGSLGLDSLMGLEIRNRLERSLGLTLPATLAWTYPTIAALTVYFDAALNHEVEKDLTPAVSPGETMRELDDLSEAEAQELLQHELAALDSQIDGGLRE